MNTEEKNVYFQLLEKSQEAFVVAVELYNKPTIKYRVEGFAFFVCNAWELMLKAKLLKDKGMNSLFYKDKEGRTISFEKCLQLVFTNEKDPLRKNLERILELRNCSTHFVTQEYEMIYVTLFQACAFNFVEKLFEFHGINITERIPSHFINLSISQSPIDLDEIKSKYSVAVFNRLVKTNALVSQSIQEEGNNRFSICIKQDLQLVKSKDPSIPGFRLVGGSEKPDGNVMIVNKYKNVNETHPLNRSKLLEMVRRLLQRNGITIEPEINKSNIQDFIAYFNLKDDDKYCYTNTIGQKPSYSYSMSAAELIVSEVQKDNDIFKRIHEKMRLRDGKTKKPTPGAKDPRS